MLTEKTFEAGGVTIHYAEGAPNGGPLVVLHGISDRRQGLTRLIMGWESRRHVFACDMRGHGKSGRAASYRAADYFPDIAAFIEQRIGSRSAILGHSNGAMTALGVAAMIPASIEAVILLDPPLNLREARRSPGQTGDYLKKVHEIISGERPLREVIFEIFPKIGEAGIRWFEDTFSRIDPEVIRVMMDGRYFDGLDLAAQLDKVTCPALLIYGEEEKGGLVRASDVEFFLAHVRKGEGLQIRGAGHFLHAECPERILELAEPWLDKQTCPS